MKRPARQLNTAFYGAKTDTTVVVGLVGFWGLFTHTREHHLPCAMHSPSAAADMHRPFTPTGLDQ